MCGCKFFGYLLFLSTLISLGMLTFGLVIVIDTFQRSPQVSQYNNVVMLWNSKYRNIFSTFVGNISTPDQPTFALLSEDGNDESFHDIFSELSPYKPLSFISPQNIFETHDNKTFEDFVTVGGDIGSIKIRFLAIVVDENLDARGCVGMEGSYDESEEVCSFYYKLVEACVKIRKDTKWVFDNTYNGYGCQPTQETLSSVLGPWSIGRYNLMPASAITREIDYSSVTFRVRNVHDPFIEAQYLTGGTLDFGSFEQDHPFVMSTFRGYAGFIITSIGFLFVLLSCSLSLRMCANSELRRKYVFSTLEEEYSRLLSAQESSSGVGVGGGLSLGSRTGSGSIRSINNVA